MNAYKKLRSFISLVCVLALLISICSFSVAAADGGNTVTATTSATLKQGSTGTCYVYIDSTEGLAALDMTVHFDPAKVKITGIYNSVSCTLYDSVSNTDSIQFTYILDGKGSASKTRLFYFYYQALSNADVGDAYFDITVGEAYDSDLNDVAISGSKCKFTITESVPTKSCSISGSSAISTAVGKEFSLSYSFSTNQIASGSTVIQYDPELFEVVEVTAGKFLDGKIADINTELSGAVYISFVGAAYGSYRDLLTVKLRTLKNVADTSSITFKVTDLYDLNLDAYSCSGYTTTATVQYDETYLGDAPRMYVSAAFDPASNQLLAQIKLDAESRLGAGDFELRFDTASLVFASYTKEFAPNFFNVNDGDVADGVLKFSIISLEDIMTEETVLTVAFDVANSCTEQETQLNISGEMILDSLVKLIPLNCVDADVSIPATHTYSGACDTSCNLCDATRPSMGAHTPDGENGHQCVVCGAMGCEALGHRYTAEVTPAGCETEGFTTYTCSACGDRYVDDLVAATGHSYSNIDGVCTLCGQFAGTTEGVIYKLSADGTYAIAAGYNGTGAYVLIAEEYEGRPVTAIAYQAFYKCDSLTAIVIPDSVTTIGLRAFYGCDSLTSVTLGSGLTTIDQSAFHFCSSLTSIVIPDSVTTIGSHAFKDCDSLISVSLGSGLTAISDWLFYDCESLSSIVIPDGITAIGTKAFYNCDSLTEVTLGSGLTAIGEKAFYSCGGLAELVIPDSVTTIGGEAFSGCVKLTSVTLGNGLETVGNAAFRYCRILKEIVIPDSVTTLGDYALANCYHMTKVTLGSGLTTIGEGALSKNTRLQEIHYQGSKEQWEAIEKGDASIPEDCTIHYLEGNA